MNGATPWPTVPACHGWLSLDRRGVWRLRGERVSHGGLMAFLNAHYGPEPGGAWRVLNGPQRVYVQLDYAPWVWRLDGGGLSAHTGAAAGPVQAAHVDEEGNVLLLTPLGPGLLDDRDLPAFFAECRLADGSPADDAALLQLLEGAGRVCWRGLPVQPLRRAEVASHFGFDPDPQPAA